LTNRCLLLDVELEAQIPEPMPTKETKQAGKCHYKPANKTAVILA
jgi:hypothetical protein